MATLIAVWAQVSRLYRQGSPESTVLATLSERIPNWLEFDAQEQLLSMVVEDANALRYPPPAKYTARLLRAYSEAVEKAGVEDVSDRLFETISALQPHVNETAGHLSYDVPIVSTGSRAESGVTLVLKVEPHHNEVGLRMWEAGFFLTEWLLAYPNAVSGKRVLELGAGLGLTGLAAAACAGSSEVIISDCSVEVLKNLEDIVSMNKVALQRANPPCEVSVVDLDWALGGAAAVETVKWADLIIAADVLYDPTVVPHFVDVVEALLGSSMSHYSDSSSPAQAPVVVVGATLRNPKTLALFIDLVRKRDIAIYEGSLANSGVVPLSSSNEIGYWDHRPFDYEPRGVRLFALGGIPDGDWAPLREGPLGLGENVTEVDVTWVPRF